MNTAIPAMPLAAEDSALVLQQEKQRLDALNPKQSVWVSASAGSGKTTLLTERVLRLLLQGLVDKQKKLPGVLCLTYTKAGAAEMQNRIHTQLSLWASMDEAALQHRLAAIVDDAVSPEIMMHARRLFALVLEKPETVRIMTMHAFCQMLLHRFPLEAGLSPHFTLLEGAAEKTFRDEVMHGFMAQVNSDTKLSFAYQHLARSQGVSRTRAMLEQVFLETGKWNKQFSCYADEAQFQKALRQTLTLADEGSPEGYLARHCAAPHVDTAKLKFAAQALLTGSPEDKKRAEKMLQWLNAQDDRAKNFDEYANIFLTKGSIRKKLCTKKVSDIYPEAESVMWEEAARVLKLCEDVNAITFYHQQTAYFTLAGALWKHYEASKTLRACLTYDDLILKTRSVLSQQGIAPWILFKLDGGLDHLLVDEAQDTSPEQWEIIFLLLEEFLSGLGAVENVNRTLFVVGDEKQSIYSFQGADRDYYLKVKTRIFKAMTQAHKPMMDVQRVQSYRSAPAVLDYIDEVFSSDAVKKGVIHDALRHFAARRDVQGYVELWPPILAEEVKLPEPWTPPLQREDAPSASVKLAKRIADTIGVWLTQGWHIKSHDGKARPVKADDIIILLQRRSELLAPIIRALKENNVPVAGIDRMRLPEQGAVQDVLALCRFLLLPQDDLTLAEVLRGPFLQASDAQLFTLAYQRSGTLWESLLRHAERDETCALWAGYLKTLLNIADTVSSFALLSHILFRACPAHAQSGLAAMVRCLGSDAVDPLEQLLHAAQEHDAQNSISLQRFVQAVAEDDSDIKREQAKASGEVRIMTTHSAKGLEAPIVFVPDLMRDTRMQWNRILNYWHDAHLAFAATPGANELSVVAHIKESMEALQEEENRRLLYVALTRAADVLILCGAQKSVRVKNFTWQEHCLAAMQRLGAEETVTAEGSFWQLGDKETLFEQKPQQVLAATHQADLPQWMHQKVLGYKENIKILNPSALARGMKNNTEMFIAPQQKTETESYARGTLLHRLLQLLPEIPPERQEETALRFLQHATAQDSAACKADVAEVMAVLHYPHFAPIFSNHAQAEVPVIGRIAGKIFSGQIDRLVVMPSEVLIVDFKTNRPPPENLADVDDAYLAQMACYVRLLAEIYPQKRIRAGLLWTHRVRLMELDAAALRRGELVLETLPP